MAQSTPAGRRIRKKRRLVACLVAAAAVANGAAIAHAMTFGAWSPAINVESIPGTSSTLNTAALEGCPFVAQRGNELYFASNRPGGQGGLDIWVARRESEDAPWGAPQNFAEVNSPADEFCPSAHRNGKTFLFVSARPGGCGSDDIYATRLHATHGWSQPENLGCTVNSAAAEASPYLLENELYFSSTRAGGYAADPPGAVAGDSDIYVSALDGEAFGPPRLGPGLNTPQQDSRPNLRRDGLEIFFDSTRPGTLGLIDLWSATRASTSDVWSTPQNLGPNVNSSGSDLRPSLSWDGTDLYFGSTRAGGEGSQDVYVAERSKLTSGD